MPLFLLAFLQGLVTFCLSYIYIYISLVVWWWCFRTCKTYVYIYIYICSKQAGFRTVALFVGFLMDFTLICANLRWFAPICADLCQFAHIFVAPLLCSLGFYALWESVFSLLRHFTLNVSIPDLWGADLVTDKFVWLLIGCTPAWSDC